MIYKFNEATKALEEFQTNVFGIPTVRKIKVVELEPEGCVDLTVMNSIYGKGLHISWRPF